jgi:hypothetical protein
MEIFALKFPDGPGKIARNLCPEKKVEEQEDNTLRDVKVSPLFVTF